jgi:ATP-dependent Clp protease ATP-binding subunit ClpA
MLSQVSGLLANRGIELRFSRPAIELIAEAGYDPANGARPLARVIDRIVNGPLSQKTISGEIKAGDCVEAVVEAGTVCFRVGESGGPAFQTV